jgi:serine/threonine protein kinase
MLGFEDRSVMDEFAAAQTANPMARKVDSEGHTVYLSHNNFGELRRTGTESPFFSMYLKIVDFGLAQRGEASKEPLLFPIQCNKFQAPEVMLGTGWSYSADIWNLGVLVSYANKCSYLG